MSRRYQQTREALAQDDLLKVVNIGFQMQQADLQERSFSARLATESYEIAKAAQTEDARAYLTQSLSTIDPLSPDAPQRLREIQAGVSSVLPASEFRGFFAPVEAQVNAHNGLITEFKTTYGINPVIGEDGRYDLAATRQQARELETAYATSFDPITRGALERSAVFQGMTLAEKAEYGKQHLEAKAFYEWGVENNLIDPSALNNTPIYLDMGASSTLPTFDPSGKPSATSGGVRAGHIFDLAAVKGLRTTDGQTLGAAYKRMQEAQLAAQQQAGLGKALGEQAADERGVLNALQATLTRLEESGGSGDIIKGLQDQYLELSKRAIATVDQAGAARTAGAGALPSGITAPRANVTNTQVGESAAQRTPVPIPAAQVPANMRGQVQAGQRFTDPNGVIYIITE